MQDWRLESSLEKKVTGKDELPLAVESEWKLNPQISQSLGEIVSVDASRPGEVAVFGRSDRIWGMRTFDNRDVFQERHLGPISNNTIAVFDVVTEKLLNSFGSGHFYMPHGLTIAPTGHVWVTDVALHQVFRFSPNDLTKPDIVLGEAFVPGSDDKHFCKPTDVAVSSTGVVFISDGYCNSRIVIVNPLGSVLGEIATGDFNVAHAITLIESEDLVCVADRENQRASCYSAGLRNSDVGTKLASLRHPFSGSIYGITSLDKVLFMVNGPREIGVLRPSVAAFDLTSGKLLSSTMSPSSSSLLMPHDLSVSGDGRYLFVADMDPRSVKKVYRLDLS